MALMGAFSSPCSGADAGMVRLLLIVCGLLSSGVLETNMKLRLHAHLIYYRKTERV